MTEHIHTVQRGWRRDDIILVDIEDIDGDGFGVGSIMTYLESQKETRKYRALVPRTVPGDKVQMRVTKTYRRDVIGVIENLVEPSKMRREAPCLHFRPEGGNCGGCSLQHLDYRHQLAVKERRIKKLFQANGLDPGLVAPVRPSPSEWYYRNKMEFSFAPGIPTSLGLHPPTYKYDVIALEQCHIFAEWAPALVIDVRTWAQENGIEGHHFSRNTGRLKMLAVREGKRTGQKFVELVTTHFENADERSQMAKSFQTCVERSAATHGFEVQSLYLTEHFVQRGSPSRFEEHLLAGTPTFQERLELPGNHSLSFDIAPRAFFQPNPRQAEKLYAHVVELLGEAENVLDLYCGTGTIGLCIAPFAGHVTGVELQPTAIDNARANARINGIENTTFIVGDVGSVLPSLNADAVVVDPPRAGLTRDAIGHLNSTHASRLVYVSCNPETLARDLKILAQSGWTIHSVDPFDMFPQTHHVENVTLLTR